MIKTWDEFYMRMAMLAAQKSKDSSTQVGAVLVKDKRVVSLGYNGLPERVRDPNDIQWQTHGVVTARNERPEKYLWYEHAERNAIYNAAREGTSTLGAMMYTNGTPCCNCARGVIQAGIYKVVVHKYFEDHKGDKWKLEADRSRAMFKEASIELVEIDTFLGVKILRNGILSEV